MKRTGIGFVLRWRIAGPALAAIAAMAATAGPAAAAPAPPVPGATPAVQPCDVHCRAVYYTGSDGRVYTTLGAFLGGRLIGGPGAGPSGGVFGRGTDNALWRNLRAGTWSSLRGRLTSRPGVAAGALAVPGGQSTDVVVRGADGAVWDRESTTALQPWRSLGGRVLAGSGPAAVNVGGTLYVLVVSTDRAVWVTQTTDGTHWSGWRWLGGRVSGDLGAASPVQGVGIVFARGSDNAAWYNQFAGTTAGITLGWHSLGGRLTSGVGAAGSIGGIAGSPPTDDISVVVMGADNRIWACGGIWPKLSPWSS